MPSSTQAQPTQANPTLADPWARLHDTVDGLEAYLRLLQDEGEGHIAPWTGCKQHLERIRRLASEAAQARSTTESRCELADLASQCFAQDYEPLSCEGTAFLAWNPPWLTCHEITSESCDFGTLSQVHVTHSLP